MTPATSSTPSSSLSLHTVHKPKITSLLQTSDADFLFTKPNAEADIRGAASTTTTTGNENEKSGVNQEEVAAHHRELKNLVMDGDDDDLSLDAEDYASSDSDNLMAQYRESMYSKSHGNFQNYGLEQEEEDDDFINNGDPDAPNPRKKSRRRRKNASSDDAAVAKWRRTNNDHNVPTSEPLMMDELEFFFVTIGLSERKPGFYIQADKKVKHITNAAIHLEDDEDDDFDLELVEVEDEEEEEEDPHAADEGILSEDLLNATSSRTKPTSDSLSHSNQQEDDEDEFGADDFDMGMDHHKKQDTTTKSALLNLLVENDEKKSETSSPQKDDDASTSTDEPKKRKKPTLDHRPLDAQSLDDLNMLDMMEDEEDQNEATPKSRILERLKNLKGRGASILAMSLTASTKISPAKEDIHDALVWSPSPNKKRKTAQSAPEPECTFFEDDSEEDDEEEREKRHNLEIMRKMREKRSKKQHNPSPLMLQASRTSSLQHQPQSKAARIALARKRKRVEEAAFQKRRELASKFSARYKRQKTSSSTANKVSSVGSGFFSSFQKKETTTTTSSSLPKQKQKRK